MVVLIWIVTVPTGIAYLLTFYPLPDVNWTWLAFTVALGFLSIYYPMVYNGKSIVLFVWFTLPVFLLYGLTAEVLVTQVIVIAAVLAKAHTGDVMYRLFYNSLAYFLLSFVSAAAYALTGAHIGTLAFGALVLGIFAYQITYSVLYDAVFVLYSRLTGRMRKNTFKETLFHYVRLIIIVPLSMSLYYMLALYGFIGYFLVGIPFFFITLVLRLNTQQEDLNDYIESAGKIGRQLTAKTSRKGITEEFMTETAALFGAYYVYLYEYFEGWLEPRQFYVQGEKSLPPEVRLGSGQGIAGRTLTEGTGIIFSRREQWKDLAMTAVPANFESLLCVPLTRNHKPAGAVVIGSEKRDAFSKYHLNVLDLLSSYYIVAMEKAMYIEEAEKENNRCALTGLFNYRFLEGQLTKDMALLMHGNYTAVSVVMLDIDHFKKVNDTYGHESGNQVLKQLGRILQENCPENGTIARYGGEEFVYILPGFEKSEAVGFAEMLRKKIGETGMVIGGSLTGNEENQVIAITSSFGVSSAPEDTDEAMALLRNADRALYIGAKQAGRNRVGSYVK
ncbi:hypothetical protein NCCP2716_12980 [Sporosarcina sp. NCCP-2716]|nr:hypothetical protein NCCP2716_12980 [Sporosarcina sp. NCCP-2716]